MAVFVFGQPGIVTSSQPGPAFADTSWQEIAQACQEKNIPENWAVGDSKIMQINNVEYQVDIIGKNHDVYSDGTGTAPLTFQLHDTYETKYGMNSSNTNTGGWMTCLLRNTHLPTILALMPAEVQTAIREVNKLSSSGGGKEAIQTTADKLFLLSEIEVFGAISYSFAGEGRQYDYYANGGSKIKNFSGAAEIWRVRSPSTSSTAFCRVTEKGVSTSGTSAFLAPISFAFCF